MGYVAQITNCIAGQPLEIPETLAGQWPELRGLRYRRGGLPLHVGGWFLGKASVAAITLGRTVFLASSTRLDAELLLHELRHVQHFAERRSFPLSYIWESLRRGYYANRYEADARAFAARRIARAIAPGSDEDA